MFWRAACDAELDGCLAIAPRHLGAELVGRERALAAWRWLLRQPGFQNTAIFEGSPAWEGAILGFGAAVFVTPGFVDEELANPRPGLNARFMASVCDARPATLDAEQLRHRNAYDGLDVLCLLGVYPQDVGREQALEILACMAVAFVEDHVGYRLRRLISEPIGEMDIATFTSTGVWRRVRSFDALTPEDAELWGRDRALFVTSREEVLSVPTANTNPLFRYSDPILRLREADQELLRAALDDLTDEDLAQRLNVHVGTVKKRWLEIYHHIAETHPELFGQCHANGDKTRGKQKRHHVLAYLRAHPEELRPYEIRDPAEMPAL